ncbi:MAG: hypothetical protein ACK5PS_16260 [Desulfopila sp.]
MSGAGRKEQRELSAQLTMNGLLVDGYGFSSLYPKRIGTENAVTAPRSFMVYCGRGTWSSHAGLSETHQHGKRCYRAEDFHGLL